MATTKRDMLFSGEAFGTTLLIIMFDTFGPEFLYWEPETLELELVETFGDTPSQDTMDRLAAAMAALTSNLFFISLEGFNTTCVSLNFKRMAGDMFIPASIEDVVWGITEVRLIIGTEEDKDNEFSRDIRLYVGKLLEDVGILDPPEMLRFAQLKKLGTDAQVIADLPDLTEVFEANQADSKEELDKYTINKIKLLMDQIAEIKLTQSDLSEFKKLAASLK